VRFPGLRRYLAALPLTDRVTFATEVWSSVLYGVFSGITLPLIPIVARTIGMSAPAIAVMLTMQFVGALLGIGAGALADRLPRMHLVTWPALAARLLIIPLGFIKGPGPFLVLSSLFYFLSNLNGPPYMSIMRSNYSDANRGRLMGAIRMVIVAAAAVCGAAAALALTGGAGAVRWLFLLAGAAGVGSAVIFSRIKVRRLPAAVHAAVPRSLSSSLRALRGNGRFLLFMAIYFLCAAPDKLTVSLEPIRFVDELAVDYHWAALVLGTVVSLASLAGYFVWSRTLKRRRSFTLFTVLVFLFALRFALVAAAPDRLHLIPASIMSGFTTAGWDLIPLFCILELADPAHFSLSWGFHTTLLGVRGIAGPFLGAFLYTPGGGSTAWVFWLVAGLTGLGAVCMLFFTLSQNRRMASRAASMNS
jgi:hypothetical protein